MCRFDNEVDSLAFNGSLRSARNAQGFYDVTFKMNISKKDLYRHLEVKCVVKISEIEYTKEIKIR
jgi:hypothetical protein